MYIMCSTLAMNEPYLTEKLKDDERTLAHTHLYNKKSVGKGGESSSAKFLKHEQGHSASFKKKGKKNTFGYK